MRLGSQDASEADILREGMSALLRDRVSSATI